MLLALDVGNTNITIGIFKEEELMATFRMTTGQARTSDEFGIFLCNLIEHRGIEVNDIKAIIVGSVVPNIMYSLTSGIIKYFEKEPINVHAGLDIGITIKTDNPGGLGADRIIDAAAGYTLYGGPIIVADFGTATTYDLISEGGELLYTVTATGIKTSANAMWQSAAKLPKIEIRKPETILAKETISGMQAGLVYGTIGQTEYIIRKIKEESGYTDAKVIATGGLGRIIARETDIIDVYDTKLTLTGLRLIYERNQK